MKLSLSARTVYSFLDYDTEYGNDHSGYGTEWSGVVSSGLVVRCGRGRVDHNKKKGTA